MQWYHYIAAFLAGFFLTNIIPHFVSGVTGNEFPSPFGDPPGVGPSSPVSNVIWGLINMLIGYALLRFSKTEFQNTKAMAALFLGIAVCSVATSVWFGKT